ncbi:hypothetical protein Nepgr_031611 [Nepenthes gracilis]|uniref:RING-type E3 ubiquitin transferase n=1 Tax=Nepenthes gracilis TaxID=150966 RepID=A0AAD3TIT9_NEPGR|nr:hypothetical protein Nepgr_031611 [Nepenthes gracilis]
MSMPFPFVFLVLRLILFPFTTVAGKFCSNYSCGVQLIRFPFGVVDGNQYVRCCYPGFELTCSNQSQPLLDLGSSGEFAVQEIDYINQLVLIADPSGCLPKRILNLNLSDSPFTGVENKEYSFFKCTNLSSSSTLPVRSAVISCLSGDNYSVIVTHHKELADVLLESMECNEFKTVSAPNMWWSESPNGYPVGSGLIVPDYLQLRWSVPEGGICDADGGFKNGSGLDVERSISTGSSGSGLSRGVKYALIIGLGVLGIICIIGLTLYISGRFRSYRSHRSHPRTEFSHSIFPQPIVVKMGLDGPTIESYPKIVLGESRRLPNPSNFICSICLSDYLPQETLRTIPECNHYFHAKCIDEWLKLKATCPLCRNSPNNENPVMIANN